MIFKLDKRVGFPDPRKGEKNGLFAYGGVLSIEQVELAYSYGILPWFPFKPEDNEVLDEDGNPYIQWYCPMDRFVLLPGDIHISHSMRQLLKKVYCAFPFEHPLGIPKDFSRDGINYVVSYDRAFHHVIDNCGKLREMEKGAWLGPDIKKLFKELHSRQRALSVDVWEVDKSTDESKLVGGLYGVYGGNYFCGESMFSLVPSASKIALIALASNMERLGLKMIDLQFETGHLKSMGGRHISYKEYLEIIYGKENLPLKF